MRLCDPAEARKGGVLPVEEALALAEQGVRNLEA
jgi:hypothetical protein